ncbi:hypothetical protein R6Q59_003640 [Mikania micrantha]
MVDGGVEDSGIGGRWVGKMFFCLKRFWKTNTIFDEICRCGPQTADVLRLKKQTPPKRQALITPLHEIEPMTSQSKKQAYTKCAGPHWHKRIVYLFNYSRVPFIPPFKPLLQRRYSNLHHFSYFFNLYRCRNLYDYFVESNA